MQNALRYSHTLLNDLIKRFNKGIFIDATLGNGHDIQAILNHPYFQGHVYGFDIQETAIEATHNRLNDRENNDLETYSLVHASHDLIDQYVQDDTIHGAIYNLGYLPGGDHSITTEYTSTLASIKQVLHRLAVKGQIILVVYAGHEAGQKESTKLQEALSNLSQEYFQVLQFGFINQQNNPPYLLIIERIKAKNNDLL